MEIGIFTIMGSRSISVAMTLACFFKAVFLTVDFKGTLGAGSALVEFSLLIRGLRIAVFCTVVTATSGGVVFVVAVLARVARVDVAVAGAGAGFERVEVRVEGLALEVITVRDVHQRSRPSPKSVKAFESQGHKMVNLYT